MEDLNKDVAETTTEMLADMSGADATIPEGGDIVTAISNFFFDNANNPEMLTNVLNDGIELAEERERSTDVITDVEISNDVLSFAEEAASFVPVFQGVDEIKNVEPFVKEFTEIAHEQNGFTTIPNLTVSMTSEQLALLENTHGGSFINNIGNADLAAVPVNAVTFGNLDSFYKANTENAKPQLTEEQMAAEIDRLKKLEAEETPSKADTGQVIIAGTNSVNIANLIATMPSEATVSPGFVDTGYDPAVDYSATVLTSDGIIKDTVKTSTDFDNLQWKPEMRLDPVSKNSTEHIRGCTSSIQHIDDLGFSNASTVVVMADIASELSTVNLVQESRVVIAENVGSEFMSDFTTPESAVPSNVYSAKDFTIDIGAPIPVVNVLTDVEASPNLEEHLKTISEADAKYAFELGNNIGKPMLAHSLMMKKLVEMSGSADIASSLIPEQQVIATPIDATKPIESDVDTFSIPDVLESENEIESSKVGNVEMSANAGPVNPLKNPNLNLAAFAAIAAGLNTSNGFNDLNMPAYLPVPNLKHLKRSGTPNSSNVLKTRAKNKAAAKARKRNRK